MAKSCPDTQSSRVFRLAASRQETAHTVSQASARRGTCACSSFNDLIRPPQNRLRDRDAECLGRLEVDHQLELHRLFDGKVGGLGAPEDLVDITGGAAE